MKNYFMSHLLLRIGACLLLGISVIAITFEYQGIFRSFSPNSKLNFFDERIASVNEEFMRRSPRLRTNFAHFKKCIVRPSCSPEAILAERNQILKEEWPDILERLIIVEDWGDGRLTKPYQINFQADLKKAGGPTKAKYCFPRIRYYLDNTKIIHTYEGLRCP